MDIVISFFRDTLAGPFYIVWVIVCIILIFACIGYLAEKGINNKKEKEKYATIANDENSSGNEVVVEDVALPITSSDSAEVVNNSTITTNVNSNSNDNTSNNVSSVVTMPIVEEVSSVTRLESSETTPVNNQDISLDNSQNNTLVNSNIESVNNDNINNSQPVVEVVSNDKPI